LFSRQHVRLATGTADNEGHLLYAHGDLVLVLARLDHWSHGKMRGNWLVKVAFGCCSDGGPGLFETLDAAEAWIARRYSLAQQEEARTDGVFAQTLNMKEHYKAM
jgi:hypothetical protein